MCRDFFSKNKNQMGELIVFGLGGQLPMSEEYIFIFKSTKRLENNGRIIVLVLLFFYMIDFHCLMFHCIHQYFAVYLGFLGHPSWIEISAF